MQNLFLKLRLTTTLLPNFICRTMVSGGRYNKKKRQKWYREKAEMDAKAAGISVEDLLNQRRAANIAKKEQYKKERRRYSGKARWVQDFRRIRLLSCWFLRMNQGKPDAFRILQLLLLVWTWSTEISRYFKLYYDNNCLINSTMIIIPI